MSIERRRGTPPPIPEKKDGSKPSSIEVAMETRVSSKHPDHNEDAALGDLARIQAEKLDPPALKTPEPTKDLAAIRAAGDIEAKHAKALRDIGAYGVFDGVSGKMETGTGLIASRIASAATAERLSSLPKDWTVEMAKAAVKEALEAAHAKVSALFDERTDKGANKAMDGHYNEMSTTADVCMVKEKANGKYDVVIGHVGDGRVMVFDAKSGTVRPVTKDDGVAKALLLRPSEGLDDIPGEVIDDEDPDAKRTRLMLMEHFVKAGLRRIDNLEYDRLMGTEDPKTLPEDLRKIYKLRNTVLKGIGQPGVPKANPDVIALELDPGDRIIITSDGVHDNLTPKEIAAIVRAGGGTKELLAAASKVAESGSDRAKPDDITGVVIDLGKAPAAKRSPAAPPAIPEAVKRASIERQADAERRKRIADIQRLIEEEVSEDAPDEKVA